MGTKKKKTPIYKKEKAINITKVQLMMRIVHLEEQVVRLCEALSHARIPLPDDGPDEY